MNPEAMTTAAPAAPPARSPWTTAALALAPILLLAGLLTVIAGRAPATSGGTPVPPVEKIDTPVALRSPATAVAVR